MAQPATEDLPLIMISYHSSDEYWAERLFSRMVSTSERKYGVCLELVYDDGGRRFEGVPIVPSNMVKVAVILISPEYVKATRVTSEGPSITVQDVFWLLVQDTPKEQLRQLPSHYIGMNATPLAEATTENSNAILAKVANAAGAFAEHGAESQVPQPEDNHQFFPLASVSRYSWSDEAEEALTRARRLASTTNSKVVTTPALLFGLAEGGRQTVNHFRTPQFLWEELTARGEDLYTKMLMDEFPALVTLGERAGRRIDSIPREADVATPNVIKLLELAKEIARCTVQKKPQAQVGTRHLLAALLVLDPEGGPTGASLWLKTFVGDVTAMRERFYNLVVKYFPDDDHEAWRPILINLKLPEIEPEPTEQTESQPKQSVPQPTVAGFMADEWHGRDLLGIEHDVNALASLVAAYKVEPPLSIGLFGDWGSGKSHFMRQMRKRVDLLSKRTRDSGKPQNELGYYKNIVQIEFNAWHYIEGNLWASLVDHIFANLRLSEDEPHTLAEQRRDELIQKLDVKQEIQNKINSEVQECEDELRKLTDRKERAEAELQEASTQLKGFREEVKASLKTLSVPVNFSEEEKKLLSRLGIQTSTELTGADVHRNYLQLKDRWTSLRAKWRLFRSDGRVVRRYVLSTLLVVIAIGTPALLKLTEVPRLPTVVVSALGFLATFLAAAKPAWDQFQKSLNALEKHDLELERERQKRITELESEVSALTKEVVAAKLESEAVGEEIQKLKADIKSTNSSRILAEFIEDRAAATDYRRHLGLLALIRRDFEKMRDLFQEQRKEANDGKSGEDAQADLNRIDRIVLYIDDLDRCPPDRVVQVLQAIHLLLAFPLFVVVVGVDSRWITRSLQQSYEWLQEADEIIANGGAEQGEDPALTGSGVTPHDYLEKIFQIPFWLRPMNDDACIEFLDGLTNDAPTPDQNRAALAPTQLLEYQRVVKEIDEVQLRSAPDVDKPFDSTTNAPIKEPLVVRSGRATLLQSDEDLAPRSLTFTTHEVEYMKKLVPLIGRSPRAVKRFLNCYRLIKVGLGPAEFEKFVGENGEALPYKAAMILLGVITGTPTVSAYVLDMLKTCHGPQFNFESFSGALLPNIEMRQKPDGERLVRFLDSHDFGTTAQPLLEEMLNCA